MEKRRLEGDFYSFVKAAWPIIDPSPFVDGWHIEAMCQHLQAVVEGRISRLLINLPPRLGKSLICSVMLPAWVWSRRQISYRSGPQVEFLCGSYGIDLAVGLGDKTRELIKSPWYEERWGERYKLRSDRGAAERFENTRKGVRSSVSVQGSLLGFGGAILVCDDPHNIRRVESDSERQMALDWWHEFSTTRLNDQTKSAIIVVMQRLHEVDVSGDIIGSPEYQDYVHLMLPARYDPRRHCTTYLGRDETGREIVFSDPRTVEGQTIDEERFSLDAIDRMTRILGPYLASGRLQQSPSPTGGGIIEADWWQLWPAPGYDPAPGQPVTYPEFSYILGSLDTALTEKEENDWSALVVFGVWHDRHGHPKLCMIEGWRGRLSLPDLKIKVLELCRRRMIDHLLIEGKANGHAVEQELRLLVRGEEFTISLFDPSKYGDKVARLYACQPLFVNKCVFAPDTQWATDVIEEVAVVPKGRHDDLADCVSQAIIHLRKSGLIMLAEESSAAQTEALMFRGSGGGNAVVAHYLD